MGPRKGVAILLIATFCVGSVLTSQALPLQASKRTLCNIYGGCGEDPPAELKRDSSSYGEQELSQDELGEDNPFKLSKSELAKHALTDITELMKKKQKSGSLNILFDVHMKLKRWQFIEDVLG